MHIADLETPVPVVDMDRMQANITRLQVYMDEHKIANRGLTGRLQDGDIRGLAG